MVLQQGSWLKCSSGNASSQSKKATVTFRGLFHVLLARDFAQYCTAGQITQPYMRQALKSTLEEERIPGIYQQDMEQL
jgi:predicted kinase